jgi:hypothetical protein
MKKYIDRIERGEIKTIQLSGSNQKIDDFIMSSDVGVYITKKVKIKHNNKYI